jgi:hypothetical protein
MRIRANSYSDGRRLGVLSEVKLDGVKTFVKAAG